MAEPAYPSLPFVTRDMLKFGSSSKLQLRIQTTTNVDETLLITVVTREGTTTYTQVVTAVAAVKVNTFALSDIPIFLAISSTSGSIFQGDIYSTATLLINGNPIFQFCSGLVYPGVAPSYPVATNPDMRPGGGKMHMITSADPGVGAETSITVPVGQLWRVLSVTQTLVAAAAAASRRVQYVFQNSGGGKIYARSNTDQIISETKTYSASILGVVQTESIANIIQIALPQDIWIDEGGTITTETLNINASDNFGTALVRVEIFMSPQI